MINYRKLILYSLSGLTGLTSCGDLEVRKQFSDILSSVTKHCLSEDIDKDVSLAALHCIRTNLNVLNEIEDSDKQTLVHSVQKFLSHHCEDHQATAVSIMSSVWKLEPSQEPDVELLLLSLLLSTSSHDQAKEESVKHLSVLAEVKKSSILS